MKEKSQPARLIVTGPFPPQVLTMQGCRPGELLGIVLLAVANEGLTAANEDENEIENENEIEKRSREVVEVVIRDQQTPIVFHEGCCIRMKVIKGHFKMKGAASAHGADLTAESEAVPIVGREKIQGRLAAKQKEKKRFVRK